MKHIGGYELDNKSLKSKSEAWREAKKKSRRKAANWIPVGLHTSGKVICMSLIRGNYWLQ